VAATLRTLAAAGYGAVEGFGARYEDAAAIDVLAKGLAETGLTMPTAHFG
jgi:sugar phosphate isomerase/epimerase